MYSRKVKAVMIMMVFLMTFGFVVLLVQPFLGGGLFGTDPASATRDIIDEARTTVRENKCAKGMKPGTAADACKEALIDLGSGYTTLAAPDQQTQEEPKNASSYKSRSLEAFRLLYQIDPKDKESVELYASALNLQSKYTDALPLYRSLARQYPTDTDYLFAWGQTAQAAQKNDEAIKAYRLVIKRGPDEANVDSATEAIKQIRQQEKEQASGANNISLG